MKQDNFTAEALEAYLELQKPIWHIPTNLGINKFKQGLKGHGLSSHMINKMVKIYKRRSWMEFWGISRGRGTFPTHPVYGNKLNIIGTKDTESPVSDIKVKTNGKTKNK